MGDALREILESKGHEVFAVTKDASVAQAVALMNRHLVGSVVVANGGVVEGILTERDVLARVVEPNLDPSLTLVATVMTRCPTCASPSMTLARAMAIMTARRQRHLPVCEGPLLVGLVSIGDIVHHLSQELERQVLDLTSFVHGPYARPSSVLPTPPWDAASTHAGGEA